MEMPANLKITPDEPRSVFRGQIYMINEGDSKPTGTEMWSNRPGIIISNDTYNKHSFNYDIVYLTTSEKRSNDVLPTHVDITSTTKPSTAMCEQIHTVDASRLGEYMGELTESEIKSINMAILFSLGISNSTHPAQMFKKWESYINKYHMDEQFNNPIDIENRQPIVEQTTSETTSFETPINQTTTTPSTVETTNITIDILTKERDAFKQLYETQLLKIQQIQSLLKL